MNKSDIQSAFFHAKMMVWEKLIWPVICVIAFFAFVFTLGALIITIVFGLFKHTMVTITLLLVGFVIIALVYGVWAFYKRLGEIETYHRRDEARVSLAEYERQQLAQIDAMSGGGGCIGGA